MTTLNVRRTWKVRSWPPRLEPLILSLGLFLFCFPTQAQFANKNSVLRAILADSTTIGYGAENMFYVGGNWGAYYEAWCPYGSAAQAFTGDGLYLTTSGRARVSWSVGTTASSGSYLTVSTDGTERTRASGYSGYKNSYIDFSDGSHQVNIQFAHYGGSDVGVISRMWVDTQPVFYQSPSDVYALSGNSVSMTAKAWMGTMSYEWYDHYNNYLGSGSTVYFTANSTTAGLIRCKAYNKTLGASYYTETYATLYLITSPVITAEPSAAIGAQGGSASFSVGVSGYQLSYQWYKNGSPISGANSSTFYLYGLQASDAANYKCSVWNGAGSRWSSEVSLTLASTPIITAQPVSITREPGTSATFSVSATGLALSYQWYKDTTNAIPGATANSYTIPSVQLLDAANFQAKVWNVAGTVWSSNAVLTTIIPPAITAQPVSLVVTQGFPASFSITASGSPASYQWRKGSIGSESMISDGFDTTNGGFIVQDSGTFEGPWTYSSSAGTWRTDGQSTANSQPNSSRLTAPTITLSHAGIARLSFAHRYNFEDSMDGGQVQVSVNGGAYATVGFSAFSQGGYNGELLQMIVPNGRESELRGQRCYTGRSFKYGATLPSQRYDIAIANLGNFNAGDSLSVQFLAAYNDSYRPSAPNWEIDSASLQLSWNDLSLIPGATGTNYTIDSAQVNHTAPYSVVISNAAGVVTSDMATLTVLVPPTITSQPTGGVILADTSMNLSVIAAGTAPLSYQWQYNNAAIAGATSNTLPLANIRVSQSGAYRAIVSNIAGRATSSVAVVTAMLPPSIVAPPESVFTNIGAHVTLRASATSAGLLSYQWFFRGQALSGATNATLTFPSAELANAGDYWVRVRNPVASVDSRRVWVVLGPWENLALGWGDSSSGQTVLGPHWTNLVAVASGAAHTLGLRGDGVVLAAGADDVGQLSIPQGVSRSVAVAAGRAHGLALHEDGTVSAWGSNDFGQTNVTAGLSNVVAIAAGADHSAALKGDGSVQVWGGEIQDIRAVPAAASNVVALAASARYTAALRRDGRLVVWGSEMNGIDAIPWEATNLNAVAAGASHLLALRADGTPLAWGDNSYEQTAVPADAKPAVSIAAGAYHSIAVLADGRVAAWGAGASNRTDEWPHFAQSSPPDLAVRATCIAGGTYFTVAGVAAPPRFLVPPPSRMGYSLGGALTLSAKALGCLPIRYAWYKDGALITGQTNAELTLGPLGPYAGAIYSASITNPGGELNTGPISVECDTPYDPLQIVQQPVGVNTLRQGNAILSVGIQGTGPISLQWYGAGSPIAGATNDYLKALTAELTDSASYHVVASNPWESLTSEEAAVAVLDPPSWSESYTNTTVSAGESMVLETATTGSGPFVYQWFHDGHPIEGAASNRLAFASLSWKDEGEYGVTISNPVGSITRTFVKLHVVSPPYILADLADTSAPRGTNALFSIQVGGEPPLSLIWYRDGAILPDEFRTNMVLPGVTDADTNHVWQVLITNLTGSVTSRVASLSIIEPPVLRTQPVSVVANPNTEARFSAVFDGTQPLAYQWFLNGARIHGATNDHLVIAAVTANKQGIYEIQAANLAGTATSGPATLSANVAPVALGVSTGLTNIAPGTTLQISARVAGLGPFNYQWYWNDTPLDGQTNLDLVLSNVAPEAAGRYTFTVGNTFGSSALESTAAAEVRVVNRPFIESGPDDILALRSQPATFNVTVRSAGAVTYQWLKEGEPIVGATGATFTIDDPTAPDAGQYSVAVANAEGTTWSGVANLTFAKLPRITRQPGNVIIAPGETAHFDLAVESEFPVSYQWRLDGSDLPDETNATLNVFLPLRILGWDHKYSVIVSSAVGRVSSLHAVLTVKRSAEAMLKHSMELTQGLLLHPGWNSIYLRVQPTNSQVAELLAGVPWTSVWMWRDRENSVQFIEEMSEASWKEPDWLVNFQTNRVESFQNNLFRLHAGQAYLIHIDGAEDAFVEIRGQPILEVKQWRPDSYNLTGLPIEKGRTPKAVDYFRHSPAHYDAAGGQIKPIYRLGADGRWQLLSNDDTLEAEVAYWFYVRGGSSYAGPVELGLNFGRGLLFKRDVDSLTLTLFNHVDQPRRLWITAHPLYADGFPLMVREVTDAGVNQVEMPSAYVVDLPAGTQKQLVLGADRLRVGKEGFESVMVISDDYGFGQQIPVLVEHTAEVTETTGRILPSVVGLWVGQATLDAVSEVNSVTAITNRIRFTNDLGLVTNVVAVRYTNTPNVTPSPASAALSQRILFHNDTGGTVRMLSEVFQLHREAVHTNDVDGYSVVSRDAQPVLVTQRALLSEFKGTRLRDGEMVGRRISSPTCAFEGQAALDNYVVCSGAFGPGLAVTARFGMSASHPLNPFKHKYHPDHDNLGTDFKSFTEEAYGIVRQITLVFDEAGSGAKPASGYDELSGTYLEEVRGLHRQPIHASGRFVLRRFTTIGDINPAH